MYVSPKMLLLEPMFKENLYRPFEILLREHEVFPVDEHQHSFFEAVYIISGAGTFEVFRPASGSRKFEYSAGGLFLIPPNTTHCFKILKRSRFLFVRFTDRYIDESMDAKAKHALYLSYSAPKIALCGNEQKAAEEIFALLESEHELVREFSEGLVRSSANIVLSLIARALCRCTIQSECEYDADTTERELRMLQYIQMNIHRPELLKSEWLSGQFGLSKGYIGRYFKLHFNESLRQYVSRNRMKRVEYLVANSRMAVKEIAYDMGFTDSSHLVKNFREFCGMSPMQYRRKCDSDRKGKL